MIYFELVHVPDKDQYWIMPVGSDSVNRVISRPEGLNDKEFQKRASLQFAKFISERSMMKIAPTVIKTSPIF